jgi:hypothetical protein
MDDRNLEFVFSCGKRLDASEVLTPSHYKRNIGLTTSETCYSTQRGASLGLSGLLFLFF